MLPLPLGAKERLAHLFEACQKLGRKILLLPFYYHLTNIFKKQDLQQLDNWASVLYCAVSASHRPVILFSTPCQHRSCHTLSEMKAPGDAWAGSWWLRWDCHIWAVCYMWALVQEGGRASVPGLGHLVAPQPHCLEAEPQLNFLGYSLSCLWGRPSPSVGPSWLPCHCLAHRPPTPPKQPGPAVAGFILWL